MVCGVLGNCLCTTPALIPQLNQQVTRSVWGEKNELKNTTFFNQINNICGVCSPLSLLGPLHVPQHWSCQMQPPVIYQPLRSRLEQLSDRAITQARPAAKQQTRIRAPIEQYVELIRSWQRQQPPIQNQRKFTIDELIQLTNLEGRYRMKPSQRHVAEALRRCGFFSKRDWTNAGRNKRYWAWKEEKQQK